MHGEGSLNVISTKCTPESVKRSIPTGEAHRIRRAITAVGRRGFSPLSPDSLEQAFGAAAARFAARREFACLNARQFAEQFLQL
jgi:hypothetical protein